MAARVTQIDFRPLGQLGEIYRDAKMQGGRARLLSELGKGGSYDDISRGLLGIGDIEGGKAFATLAAAQSKANDPTARMQELVSAGIQPGSPEYRDAILASGKGATVNVNNAGETAFAKSMGDEAGKRWNTYIAEGDRAQKALVDVNNMRAISQRLGSQGAGAWMKESIGPYAEAFGVPIEGLDDIQAYTAIVERLAPQQRAPGSGSTSDIEYRGFLRSLPTLTQHPQAREAILDTIEAMQQHSIEQANVASRLANGEMSRADAERMLRSLPDPMARFRAFKETNQPLYKDALKSAWDRDAAKRKGEAQKSGAQASPSQLMDFARSAIRDGAPREAIIEELRARGIDPAGL